LTRGEEEVNFNGINPSISMAEAGAVNLQSAEALNTSALLPAFGDDSATQMRRSAFVNGAKLTEALGSLSDKVEGLPEFFAAIFSSQL
jgi:hypothetical protein